MLPNFLIVGAPRAGTTWMAKNLMEHPEVYMPRIKETHFFDLEYDKGIEYYKKYFNKVSDEKAVGEGTPNYLFLKEIPALLHKYMPEAKLIFTLRNPVDRLYSRYWNAKAKYESNAELSFEDKIKLKPLFIEEGFYYDHLVRYYELFPKENFLILLYEDIKIQPEEFMKKVYRFLQIDEHFNSPLLRNKINSAASKKKLAKSELLWNVSRGLMRLRIFKLAKYVEKINTIAYPRLEPETRKWLLEDVYMEKNKKLEELIGVNLDSWNTTEY
jgi:hypothetical protein